MAFVNMESLGANLTPFEQLITNSVVCVIVTPICPIIGSINQNYILNLTDNH